MLRVIFLIVIFILLLYYPIIYYRYSNNYVEKFISKIVRNLEGLGESEIPTPTIGKFIMDGLSSLDKVAYVRFASVYRNFREEQDFVQFVDKIDVFKKK